MPNKLQKSLQDCLSKIKKQTPHLHFSHGSFTSATRKIISSCKHPRSFSFIGEHKSSREDCDRDLNHQKSEEDNAATLEDIDRFLSENFKSLYGQNHDDEDEQKAQDNNHNHHDSIFGRGAIFNSPRFFTPPPDLCGSHGFLVSPASSSSSCPSAEGDHNSYTIPKGVEDCIAVLKVSPNPYEEFRRSMNEVIEGRVQNNERVDWDFMEELLFCYLRLNEKKQYRYILSAFVDLVVKMRQNLTDRETYKR